MEPTREENHLITHKTVFYTNDNNDSGGPGAWPPSHSHILTSHGPWQHNPNKTLICWESQARVSFIKK